MGHPEILNFMFGLTAGGYFCILKVSETLDSLFAEAAYDKRFRKTWNKLKILRNRFRKYTFKKNKTLCHSLQY